MLDRAGGASVPSKSIAPEASETAEVRESMTRLPGWMQQPLTVFTGRALSGQRPLPWWSPTYHLLAGIASLAAGVTISGLGWDLGGWFLAFAFPGWAVTLHGLRNLRMLIFHQCAHQNMYRRKQLDVLIGEALAALLVVQNLSRYKREHVADHHAAHHMTLRDPTVQAFLLTLDIHPGMPVRQMRWRVAAKVLSPAFHARFAVARVMSFWSGASRREKILGAVFYGSGLAAVILTGQLAAALAIWFVPLFPLFQVSNTLRLCVKHNFPGPGQAGRRGKEYFGTLTTAIFLGEQAPSRARTWIAGAVNWARWWMRMLLIHAPVRYMVITADTPVHDWHHRHPMADNWAHHLYRRQADSDAGSSGWGAYTEQWGYGAAMNSVLASLSAADPDYYDVRRVYEVSARERFAAFDD